jgi:hypothetical protein
MEASIDVFDPERRLRLIYLPSPAFPATDSAIVADFILEPAPPPARGVIVRLLGMGVPDGREWDVPFKRMKLGWAAALARLKVYVERQMGAGAAAGTPSGAVTGVTARPVAGSAPNPAAGIPPGRRK